MLLRVLGAQTELAMMKQVIVASGTVASKVPLLARWGTASALRGVRRGVLGGVRAKEIQATA